MKYEAKTLVNRTGKSVEFTVGGKLYSLKAGKSKTFEGIVADHALKFTNTGLEELTPELEEQMLKEGQKTMPDYQGMKYQQLVKRAKRHGWKVGMNKKDVVELLEKRWQKKYGKKTSKNTKNSSSKKSSEA